MRGTYIAVGIIVVVALGGILYLGIGPEPAVDTGAVGSDGETESEPTEPAYDQRTAPEPAFNFTVDEVGSCGAACRDVTATITNTGTDTASNVQASTNIYAGKNTTNTEAQVWDGTEDVGTLDPEASYTTSDRIELSFEGATMIQQNDGWITIQTTIESEERTTTFQRSRQVI